MVPDSSLDQQEWIQIAPRGLGQQEVDPCQSPLHEAVTLLDGWHALSPWRRESNLGIERRCFAIDPVDGALQLEQYPLVVPRGPAAVLGDLGPQLVPLVGQGRGRRFVLVPQLLQHYRAGRIGRQ